MTEFIQKIDTTPAAEEEREKKAQELADSIGSEQKWAPESFHEQAMKLPETGPVGEHSALEERRLVLRIKDQTECLNQLKKAQEKAFSKWSSGYIDDRGEAVSIRDFPISPDVYSELVHLVSGLDVGSSKENMDSGAFLKLLETCRVKEKEIREDIEKTKGILQGITKKI